MIGAEEFSYLSSYQMLTTEKKLAKLLLTDEACNGLTASGVYAPAFLTSFMQAYNFSTFCPLTTWLAMSANVSVGYTPQTTDIFVCRRHVGNVVLLVVGVMSVRPVADTHSYMFVGISTDEVVTYKNKKNWLAIY